MLSIIALLRVMSSSLVRKLEIREIVPDFSLAPFAKYSEQLKRLWTDRKTYEVLIDLVGVTDKIANAIRRTILSELTVKALSFEPSEVQTNVAFMIVDELLDRVMLLPIKQDCPDDATFSISIVNGGQEQETLYSSDISGDHAAAIPKRFHLAEIRKGEYLHIPKITIVRGTGFDHAMFSMTSEYSFHNLDYMDVAVVNIKGNRIDKRVAVAQVAKRLTEAKHAVPDDLAFKRILVIPNMDYKKLISEDEQTKINGAKYDYILTRPADSSESEQEWITECSSLTVASSEFRMRFNITDRIDPKQLIPMACDNLVNRLSGCLQDLDAPDNSKRISVRTNSVKFLHDGSSIVVDMWCMKIFGETHTLGHLLAKHILLQDPDLPFVRPWMDHPQDNNVTIQLIHSEPEKICRNAIASCIEIFGKIRDQCIVFDDAGKKRKKA
jgi:DNA-directed RNA polymerase subunit L